MGDAVGDNGFAVGVAWIPFGGGEEMQPVEPDRTHRLDDQHHQHQDQRKQRDHRTYPTQPPDGRASAADFTGTGQHAPQSSPMARRRLLSRGGQRG
ncbi:Uncharacterised protein [Mycobacterium tuberculosis]|nr:Uncharacterised protein [Mycobacterium tuberculosis]CKU39287.1 Uncharacterised protein [Mycobacterium tuberculosis]CKV93648.1 Uncharacterised protein [Mycobacterium tuberculosis]COU92062.1 Uncharacterised protein [Mycobacterium tuberculosis]COX18452.1 Uncharacterised protein [Mycobacterium tuberculosis]